MVILRCDLKLNRKLHLQLNCKLPEIILKLLQLVFLHVKILLLPSVLHSCPQHALLSLLLNLILQVVRLDVSHSRCRRQRLCCWLWKSQEFAV